MWQAPIRTAGRLAGQVLAQMARFQWPGMNEFSSAQIDEEDK
jgi:hypothetical protein